MARPDSTPVVLFIVTDEWNGSTSTEGRSRLVGVFSTEEKADQAVAAVDARWEAMGESDEHFCSYYAFNGLPDVITMPDYDDEYGDDDDDDDEDEDEDDD